MADLTARQSLHYARAFIDSALAKLEDEPEPEPTPEPEPEEPSTGSPWPAPSTSTRREVPVTGGTIRLDDGENAELVMPDDPVTGCVTVLGGHNWTLTNGSIHPDDRGNRMLYAKDWTGTVHIEGVDFDPGSKKERDCIVMDTRNPGTVMQVVDVSCAELEGTVDGYHADLLQTWAGPEVMRVARFNGSSNYQGFFLNPTDFYDGALGRWEFRDCHLVKTPGEARWCLYVLLSHDDVDVSGCTASGDLQLLGKGGFEAHEGAGLTWA